MHRKESRSLQLWKVSLRINDRSDIERRENSPGCCRLSWKQQCKHAGQCLVTLASSLTLVTPRWQHNASA